MCVCEFKYTYPKIRSYVRCPTFLLVGTANRCTFFAHCFCELAFDINHLLTSLIFENDKFNLKLASKLPFINHMYWNTIHTWIKRYIPSECNLKKKRVSQKVNISMNYNWHLWVTHHKILHIKGSFTHKKVEAFLFYLYQPTSDIIIGKAQNKYIRDQWTPCQAHSAHIKM